MKEKIDEMKISLQDVINFHEEWLKGVEDEDLEYTELFETRRYSPWLPTIFLSGEKCKNEKEKVMTEIFKDLYIAYYEYVGSDADFEEMSVLEAFSIHLTHEFYKETDVEFSEEEVDASNVFGDTFDELTEDFFSKCAKELLAAVKEWLSDLLYNMSVREESLYSSLEEEDKETIERYEERIEWLEQFIEEEE